MSIPHSFVRSVHISSGNLLLSIFTFHIVYPFLCFSIFPFCSSDIKMHACHLLFHIN
uniref:Uncharacterized protein n=1 Tax=Octopus bimaculoides TaxID=37653 RepID=A0A0L8GI41_OCTBM